MHGSGAASWARSRPSGKRLHDHTGLAFGTDGSLYVSELNPGGLGAVFNPMGDPHGALIRVWPDGHRTEIAHGQLVQPGGVAVGREGTVYVSVFSILRNRGAVVAISQ